MKKYTALLGAAFITVTSALSANAASNPDIYVVKFRSNDCAQCGQLESQLSTALTMVASSRVEEVTIDTSNGLKWQVSAHTAFDHNIVPQFNDWVGLTGFAAVIDSKTGTTIGCVSNKDDAYKMANFIKSAARLPHDRNVTNRAAQFSCPPVYNVDTGK